MNTLTHLFRLSGVAVLLTLGSATQAATAEQTVIRMANSPSLSSEGDVLVFEWAGDIWKASPYGGEAVRLTASPAYDHHPLLSADGQRVAFCSERSGSNQVYVLPIEGGQPKQLTTHSEGSLPLAWNSTGDQLLTVGSRDHHWKHPKRLFYVDPEGVAPEQLVVDAYAETGSFEAATGRILLTRLGDKWWRQGYQGSKASQAWRYDPATGNFERLAGDKRAVRSPLWRETSQSLLFLSNDDGVFNLYERGRDGNDIQHTYFTEGATTSPTLAAAAGVIVFRHDFDFYRLELNNPGGPEKISLVCRTDTLPATTLRQQLQKADDVCFTSDGLEVAFIAGNDLWVMDTVLRKPRRVTSTPGAEASPQFSPDESSILFVSSDGGQQDLWLAQRSDADAYWWQNGQFTLKRLTNSDAPKSHPQFSADGQRIAFASNDGTIQIIDLEGTSLVSIDTGWDTPSFRWSPDGKYFALSKRDTHYNRDVFVVAADGSGELINVSNHPDEDSSPRWSPDGTMLAFVGEREEEQADLFVAHLGESLPSRRYDKLAEALDTMRKERKHHDENHDDESPERITMPSDRMEDRVVRLRNPGVDESRPVWSPDSRRIAFVGRRASSSSTYVVDATGGEDPDRISDETLSYAQWLDENTLVGLVDDTPAKLNVKSEKVEEYSFRAYQIQSRSDLYAAVFLDAWQRIRHSFYDSQMHGADWQVVRQRYEPMAAQAVDDRMLAEVIWMMLGELNASHQGFSLNTDDDDSSAWAPRTAHLGAWFTPAEGGGLVVTQTSANARQAGLKVGQRVTTVDGQQVDTVAQLNQVLTGLPDKPIQVQVADIDQPLTVLPISYTQARDEAYRNWVESREALVHRLSNGRLGYLHIRRMSSDSLLDAERDVFAATTGREGLVVDVRYNGGGWIADRLLEMLAHPDHAVTYPRDGGPGYPYSRRAYPTWEGPLIALCNESSFSNAEIFSHAIKSTGRGKLVGQPTAGGVISTHSESVMGFGSLRITDRGWEVSKTGVNMEGSGAEPDIQIVALPGEMSQNIDKQLEAAVKALLEQLDS